MADAADDLTDSGLELLTLHKQGRCGEVGGPCPYCDDDERRQRREVTEERDARRLTRRGGGE